MVDDGGAGKSEAGSSSHPVPPAAPAAARPASSLLSYFGNGKARAAPAAPDSSAAAASAPKAKRPKVIAKDQARLGTTSGEGSSSGWALGKAQEAEGAVKPAAKPRKKASKVDAEEGAEMKDMAKRAKAEKKEKSKKGKAANGLPSLFGSAGVAKGVATEIQMEDDLEVVRGAPPETSGSRPLLPAKPIPPGPRVSETKRKRSHHKRQPSPLPLPASHPSSQTSIPQSTPLDSSPPTITLSSSTESDEDDLPRPNGKVSKIPRSPSLLAHPLFSRSNSAVSKGASQHDAINIDDSPRRPRILIDLADSPKAKAFSGPKKSVAAVDKKEVHGFFGMKRAAPPAVVPVDAGAAAEKAMPKEVVKDKVHSFFQAGPQGVPGKLADGWGGTCKVGEEWRVPFPGRGYPSHTGNSETQTSPVASLRKRRKLSPPRSEPLGSFFSDRHCCPAPLPSSHLDPHPHALPGIIGHPAIRSIPRRSRDANQETWCERYRPLTANQVLGNEGEATYLRDWLQLLSVGHDGPSSSSTTKITRRVPRGNAALLDGWIVDDIDDFDDGPDPDAEMGEEEFLAFDQAPSALDPRPEVYPAFGSRLANTILLTGPHGSGKSAAVYAVAEELGWEVFEVYPGIGRRTGSNLKSLVGGVGRNHVIAGKGKGKVTPKKAKAAAPLPAKAKTAAGSFFKTVAVAAAAKPPPMAKPANGGVARKRANQLPMSSQGSADEPVRLDDSDEEDEAEVLEDRKHGFRETLILLDEADLLFEEEGSFWPAVIALIAESRRPVVITCNDPERIPIPSLPLQAILPFQPPPKDLAISLLSTIATRESLRPTDFGSLYSVCTSSPLDLLAQPTPLVPNGHEPMPAFDLRRAITQLQLDRGRPDMSAGPQEVELDLRELCAGLEGRSFVDACVAPRSWAVVEMNELDRYSDYPDDLLGVHVLPKPEVHSDRPALPVSSASQEISDHLLSLLPSGPDDFPSDCLSLKQTTHIRALLPLLDPLIPLSANLLPHPSLFLETIPILRSMVLADDILEVAEEATLARGGERVNRRTGRPVRTVTGWLKGKEEGGYVRYLKEVGKEGEAVVRDIHLGGGAAKMGWV